MFAKKQKNTFQGSLGMTLLEIIVGVALVSIVTLSLYTALFKAANLMGDAKKKIGAIALANERMEIIRNLEYDDVGTTGWIPNGPISQVEELEKNGFTYRVETSIEYVDDPFDGQGAADTVENDYKQAWVEVFWMSGGSQRSVLFASRFVPDGLESNAGGGVLSINVIDGSAMQIPGAVVKIDSVNESPAIHGSTTTDVTGNIRLPGMPEQEYKVTVSKTDYETVTTYPNPPASSFTPVENANVYVIDGATVLKTITIDKSANLTFHAVDIADGDGIDGVDFELQGGRIIGSDPTTYAVDQTETSDSSGEVELANVGSGTYNITNLATLETASYQYVGSDLEIPVSLSPEDDIDVNVIFAEKTVDSLLLRLTDSVTSQPISGATVNVTATDFDQSVVTSANGIAYFPVTADPPVLMIPQEYHFDIETPGYQDHSDDIDISELTIVSIGLTSL